MGISHAGGLATVVSAAPLDRPSITWQIAQTPGNAPITTGDSRQTIPAGGAVQGGWLVRKTTPLYPAAAKDAGVAGVVTIEALIGKDGNVVATSVLDGPYPLRQSAQDAVKRFRYEPTLLNRAPVERLARVEVWYNLGSY